MEHQDDPRPAFAATVRRLRKQRGLTQERLAEEAGLNTSIVRRIEKGKREPGIRVLVKLARGLAVPVGDLFVDIDTTDTTKSHGRGA